MTETEIKAFIYEVESMRKEQVEYFKKIATARKTKAPQDFAIAANTLKRSKEHEHNVDTFIAKFHQDNPAIVIGCTGNCGMNYCDENGCVERKRNLVEPIPPQ